MTHHQSARPTVRGIGELIALLPYQLGFHPDRSLVAVARIRGELVFTARIDLPEKGAIRGVVESLLAPMRRHGIEDVCLLTIAPEAAVRADAGRRSVIGSPAKESKAAALTDTSLTATASALAAACRAAGIGVVDSVLVRSGTYRSVLPEGDPTEHPVPPAATVPVAADFALREQGVLGSRQELVASVRPSSPASGAGAFGPTVGCPVLRALDRIAEPVDPATAIAAWRAVLDVSDGAQPIEQLSPELVAQAAASLHDRGWRDALIAALTPGAIRLDALELPARRMAAAALPHSRGILPTDEGTAGPVLPDVGQRPHCWWVSDELDRETADNRLLDRLARLCRRLPDEAGLEAAAVLTVLGGVAFGKGVGSLASVALDRALDLAPGYRLAQLLDQLVCHAVAPPTFERPLRSMSGARPGRRRGGPRRGPSDRGTRRSA